MTTSTDVGIECLEAQARYATFPNEQAWLRFACDLRGFVASQKDRGYDICTVTTKIIELCAMVREANEPPLMVYVNYDIEGVAYQTGPFRAGDVAETHRRDIRAYDGVTTCYLARDRDEGRVFVELLRLPARASVMSGRRDAHAEDD
jgi:hypothetical protein